MPNTKHTTLNQVLADEATRLRDAWLVYLIHFVPKARPLLLHGKIDTAIIQFGRWGPEARGPGRPPKAARRFRTPTDLLAYLPESPWKQHLQNGSLDEDEAVVLLGTAVGCLRDPPRRRGPAPKVRAPARARGQPRKDQYALALLVWVSEGDKLPGRSKSDTPITVEQALERYFVGVSQARTGQSPRRKELTEIRALCWTLARSRLRYARRALKLLSRFSGADKLTPGFAYMNKLAQGAARSRK